jgi:hypothetical protein
VGVLHPRGQLGLELESLPLGLGRELAGQDHLQGDKAVEAAVAGLVDHAHAPPAHLPQQFVDTNLARPSRRPNAVLRDRGRGGVARRRAARFRRVCLRRERAAEVGFAPISGDPPVPRTRIEGAVCAATGVPLAIAVEGASRPAALALVLLDSPPQPRGGL